MVNAWLAPQLTDTLPDGLIEPPEPALAATVLTVGVRPTLMVWV